jgi:hypothetical protein
MKHDERILPSFSIENLPIPSVINHAYVEDLLGASAEFAIGIAFFYGSWNKLEIRALKSLLGRVIHSTIRKQGYRDCLLMGFDLQVDRSDASLSRWIGETTTFTFLPVELPAFAIMFSKKSGISVRDRHSTI